MFVLKCLTYKLNPETQIVGHRELPAYFVLLGNGSKKYRKTCPGMLVDMDEFRTRVSKGLQLFLKSFMLYEGEIDGMFGAKSIQALYALDPVQAMVTKNVSDD